MKKVVRTEVQSGTRIVTTYKRLDEEYPKVLPKGGRIFKKGDIEFLESNGRSYVRLYDLDVDEKRVKTLFSAARLAFKDSSPDDKGKLSASLIMKSDMLMLRAVLNLLRGKGKEVEIGDEVQMTLSKMALYPDCGGNKPVSVKDVSHYKKIDDLPSYAKAAGECASCCLTLRFRNVAINLSLCSHYNKFDQTKSLGHEVFQFRYRFQVGLVPGDIRVDTVLDRLIICLKVPSYASHANMFL